LRRVYCIVILYVVSSAAFAQNVAIVNGKPLSSKEFMWFYKKNHAGNANVSLTDLEAYLNLYIDFKLKVLDAKEMGLDKDTAYLAEVNEYELSLGKQKRISRSKPEYAFMKNEYRDAVLMFNLTEQKIWDKAQNGEVELRVFYEEHKSKYPQGLYEDVKGQIITDYQQSLENQWIAELRKKYPVRINEEEIRKLAKP
jgi:hypothetical protein